MLTRRERIADLFIIRPHPRMVNGGTMQVKAWKDRGIRPFGPWPLVVVSLQSSVVSPSRLTPCVSRRLFGDWLKTDGRRLRTKAKDYC
jgi:hypothetical protein